MGFVGTNCRKWRLCCVSCFSFGTYFRFNKTTGLLHTAFCDELHIFTCAEKRCNGNAIDLVQQNPSTSPSTKPTISPTGRPSKIPTISPSKTPSISTTNFPTTRPSDSPSTFPTKIKETSGAAQCSNRKFGVTNPLRT